MDNETLPENDDHIPATESTTYEIPLLSQKLSETELK